MTPVFEKKSNDLFFVFLLISDKKDPITKDPQFALHVDKNS